MEEIGTKLLATNSMTLFGLFFPHSPVAMPQKSENRPYASTHWGSSLFIVNFIVTHYYFVLFIIMCYNLLLQSYPMRVLFKNKGVTHELNTIFIIWKKILARNSNRFCLVYKRIYSSFTLSLKTALNFALKYSQYKK